MLHEWLRFVLQSSVQLALTILPAAPLLGQKLSCTADGKRVSAKHPNFRVSSVLVGADENAWWPALSRQIGGGGISQVRVRTETDLSPEAGSFLPFLP